MMVMTAAACSVKEERHGCPCVLSLDFSGLDTVAVKEVNILAISAADGIVFTDKVSVEDFCDVYVRNVPRGKLNLNVWSGDGGMTGSDCLIMIPYGVECPPIYLSSADLDAGGEICHHQVCLHKNHCRLSVEMPDRLQLPESFTFKGCVNGYGIGGHPSSGEFSCVAYPSAQGLSHARIPRQNDSSLMLEVDDGSPHLKQFAIGEYLAAGGYDWTAEDLADVTITLDYSMTSIQIKIAGWDKEEIYTIIL